MSHVSCYPRLSPLVEPRALLVGFPCGLCMCTSLHVRANQVDSKRTSLVMMQYPGDHPELYKTAMCRSKNCRYKHVPQFCMFIHHGETLQNMMHPFDALAGQKAYNKKKQESRKGKSRGKVVVSDGKENNKNIRNTPNTPSPNILSHNILPKLSQDVPAVLRDILPKLEQDSPTWVWPPLPSPVSRGFDAAAKAVTEYLKEVHHIVVMTGAATTQCSICLETTDVKPFLYNKCGCSDYFCKDHIQLALQLKMKCQNERCPRPSYYR